MTAVVVVAVQAAVLVVYAVGAVWLLLRRHPVTTPDFATAVAVPVVAITVQAVLLVTVEGLLWLRVAALLLWLFAGNTAVALLHMARNTTSNPPTERNPL